MKFNNKKLATLASLLLSFNSLAGTWYDDWHKEIITTTTDLNIYSGFANCQTLAGDYLYNNYIPPSIYPSVYLFRDNWGNNGFVYHQQAVPYGNISCEAPVPLAGQEQIAKNSRTIYTPIMPYSNNVNIERLGCITVNQRKIYIHTAGLGTAQTMQIFSAYAPYYAETLVYSGPVLSNKLLTVNTNSNTVNIRVKLDDGSSSYTAISSMSCANSAPLN